MPKPTEHDLSFVNYLVNLSKREDRAALAALRRGLGKPPGTAPEMFKWVVPWTSGLSRAQAENLFLVASLFGMHPENTESGNIGTAFATIRGQDLGGGESTEKRFVALLSANYTDLPNHLRHAIGLARSKKVPVNYAQLLADLRYWNAESHTVQRDWAREFWTRPEAAGKEAAGAGESSANAQN